MLTIASSHALRLASQAKRPRRGASRGVRVRPAASRPPAEANSWPRGRRRRSRTRRHRPRPIYLSGDYFRDVAVVNDCPSVCPPSVRAAGTSPPASAPCPRRTAPPSRAGSAAMASGSWDRGTRHSGRHHVDARPIEQPAILFRCERHNLHLRISAQQKSTLSAAFVCFFECEN